MFARFRHRRLVSSLPIAAAALLCAVFWCSTAPAADPPEVRGLIATRVHFEEDARERLAATGFELLANCTFSHTASEGEWHEALRQSHLHFTFATPRTVTFVPPLNATMKREKAEITEMIVTFPLGSGRVWVRSGDEYTWFAKWPCQESTRLCKPIQLLLKRAMPDE
jgi:hypothetical protein